MNGVLTLGTDHAEWSNGDGAVNAPQDSEDEDEGKKKKKGRGRPAKRLPQTMSWGNRLWVVVFKGWLEFCHVAAPLLEHAQSRREKILALKDWEPGLMDTTSARTAFFTPPPAPQQPQQGASSSSSSSSSSAMIGSSGSSRIMDNVPWHTYNLPMYPGLKVSQQWLDYVNAPPFVCRNSYLIAKAHMRKCHLIEAAEDGKSLSPAEYRTFAVSGRGWQDHKEEVSRTHLSVMRKLYNEPSMSPQFLKDGSLIAKVTGGKVNKKVGKKMENKEYFYRMLRTPESFQKRLAEKAKKRAQKKSKKARGGKDDHTASEESGSELEGPKDGEGEGEEDEELEESKKSKPKSKKRKAASEEDAQQGKKRKTGGGGGGGGGRQTRSQANIVTNTGKSGRP